jgi:hypothetical protein
VNRCGHIAACCAILAAPMVGGVSADTLTGSHQPPSNAQVIGYLLQSVNWYRHVYSERQVATEPADLMFLDDNRAIEQQIVKLSFDFAKADAGLETAAPSLNNAAARPAPATPPTSDLAHFIELKNRSDEVRQQASQEIKTFNERIGRANNSDRKKLQTALVDAQSRLELLDTVSQTVSDLVGFVQSAGAEQAHIGNLESTIDDLAQSIPEMNGISVPSPTLPLKDATYGTADGGDIGLLGLLSQVSAMNRKLRVVDEKIRLTDNLAISTQNLRTPLAGFITRLLQSVAIIDLQSGDLSSLREQKARLDALTLELKGLSPAIVALDKQKVLLAEYKSHVLPWRTAVARQYRQAWTKLVIRFLALLLIIGLVLIIGRVSRRFALRRVQDPNRRRLVSMIHRLVILFAVAVVILSVVASDLRSLATYFGLLSAGLLLALQNVILASLGSLLLLGKRGIRIGDRLQVSGITGDVINLGLLQFQLREFDVEKERFTGHVATFSNSLVFVSPATGLLKFNSAAGKAAKAAANRNRRERDTEEISETS